MHHHSPSSSYAPADKPMLELLERERNTTYRYTLEFMKWIVASVVAILFFMAVVLI
jgi:hypothetical protein